MPKPATMPAVRFMVLYVIGHYYPALRPRTTLSCLNGHSYIADPFIVFQFPFQRLSFCSPKKYGVEQSILQTYISG